MLNFPMNNIDMIEYQDDEEEEVVVEATTLANVLSLGYPCTEKIPARYPIRGTSKILSDFTDVGTALGTHSSMFIEQVLVGVPAPVILLRNTLQGTLNLSRSA